MKVVDASAMIDVLVGSERSGPLLAALDDDVFAPDLLVAEVFSALRRMASSHTLTNADQRSPTLTNSPSSCGTLPSNTYTPGPMPSECGVGGTTCRRTTPATSRSPKTSGRP